MISCRPHLGEDGGERRALVPGKFAFLAAELLERQDNLHLPCTRQCQVGMWTAHLQVRAQLFVVAAHAITVPLRPLQNNLVAGDVHLLKLPYTNAILALRWLLQDQGV